MFVDEIEDSYEDVNTTALNLRKNLIDSLLDYARSEKPNGTMDIRGRAIFTHDESGLDLVFVLDASSSVKREDFKLGLDFIEKLVRFIGRNGTRYCFLPCKAEHSFIIVVIAFILIICLHYLGSLYVLR